MVGAVTACLIATGSAQAAVVTVSATTLSSNAGTYGPLDAAGTTLQVTSGSPLTTICCGTWPGLWFGSTQASDTYNFTFNKQLDYFSILITAMSTSAASGWFESIGNFTTNAAAAPTLTFTDIQFTAWDGTTVTSSAGDGRFLMEIQAVGGRSFDRVSFAHIQSGFANGSVVNQIQYNASAGSVVPEPGTWALMIVGFLGAGIALRRRQGALAA